MILNIADLKKIAKGAEDIVQGDRGIEFVRFHSEEQTLYLSSPIESRTHTPAGIQLRFRTDAKTLTVEMETENCLDRSFFCLDVLKDGVPIGAIKNFDEEKMVGFYSWSSYPLGQFRETFGLGTGDKEVTLVLPWSVRCYFQKIALEDGSYITPVATQKRIVMYGDSITHGYDSAHPCNTYAVKLAKALGADCYIKAVGGEVFWPQLAQIKPRIEPEYVSVAYGANDWGKGDKATFDKNAEGFLNAIAENYKTSKILIIAPIWRKDHTQEGLGFGDMRYVYQRLAALCNGNDRMLCVDGWELVPHEENLFGDLRLHPNDQGFDLYARNLYQKIKDFI